VVVTSQITARSPAKSPEIALVGKGILFDTGGVNLSRHRSMLDMHITFAAVRWLATLLALASLKAPFAVDAWLPSPRIRSGQRLRPQEV